MIHELRQYHFRPGGRDSYMELVAGVGLSLRGDNRGRLGGFWIVDDEYTDSVVHLWEYDSLDHRQAVRASLQKDAAWCDRFLSRVLPLMQRQVISFLEPLLTIPTTDNSIGFANLVTLEAVPGACGTLIMALASHFRDKPGRLAFNGIAPWPNSIVLLLSNLQRLPALPESVVTAGSIRMHPASFSPIQ